MTPAIELVDVRKSFGAVQALVGVDLEVDRFWDLMVEALASYRGRPAS